MKKDKWRMISVQMILIIFLVNFNLILANYYQQDDTSSYVNKNKCQSGLREDNTNYIYCARQNLTYVPNFFQTHIGISNVVYDELVLSDNLISQLDKNTFPPSLKVRKLYLDSNPIRYIDKIAFEYLRNYLEELYLDLKIVTSGDELLVQSNHDYSDYIENDEQLNEEIDDGVLFEQSILQSCFNLRLLTIKNYNIKKLRSLKFTKMNKLEILTLSKLKLKRIDDNAFVGLEQSLVELNLDSNYLESISISSIEQLKRLKKLNLSQNRIKHLSANSFFKFSSTLNYLDLSYNYLSKIDENAFNGPIQNGLKYLQLQNNELKWPHFINILYNLHLLQELNIDFNKLFISNNNEITDSILMPNVHNKTSYIYLKLNTLSMQGNGLTEQTLNMFGNSYDYDIASNSFEYASSMVYTSNKDTKQFKFTNLTKLNLARNKITQIPDKFFDKLNMTMLKVITLDRNPFDVAKFNNETFYGLEKSLQSLTLNNVGIDVFASNFIQSLNVLENLQILKLNNNNNKNLPDYETESTQFKLNLKNLNSLELQNNNIKRMPSYFCQLENLRDLDLSSNKLTNFDLNCLLFKLKENYYESTSLNHLNLNNNPLKCDCNMRQLKIWLMRNYEKDFLEFIKWKCNEPFELNEKLLTSVSLSDLKCEEKSRDSQIVIHNEDNVSTTTESTTTMTTTTIEQILITTTVLNNTEKLNLVSSSYENKKPINNLLSYNGYYTLIISISFGISIICLMLLILFYFVYIRKHQQYEYKNSSIISNINSDYLNYNTTSNNNLMITSNAANMNGGDCMVHKNKLTFLTSSQSPSGCSSAASTSSSGTSSLLFNNTTRKFDLIEMFAANESNHNDNSNLYLHKSMNLNEFQLFNSESSSNNYNHLNNLFFDNKINRNNNNNTINRSNQNTEFCSDYNNLNYDDSIFSIENSMLKSGNCDNHIYHEINTPNINKMKFLNQNRTNQQNFKYGNQLLNNNSSHFSTHGLIV